MLIVNADDYGMDTWTTNNILACFRARSVTSTSAMVFMQDSERAADLGLENNLEVGLHVNFDTEFTGSVSAGLMKEYQGQVAAFLTRNKFNLVMYNPWLQRQFEYLYKAQYDEFVRLYRRPPTHINGHGHKHLCSNVLLGGIIPTGMRVRRSFAFARGERHFLNRIYRRGVDVLVTRRYITTDMFFDAAPTENNSLKWKVELAKDRNVELMVHASSQAQLEYLLQQAFIETIHLVAKGTYRDLPGGQVSKDLL